MQHSKHDTASSVDEKLEHKPPDWYRRNNEHHVILASPLLRLASSSYNALKNKSKGEDMC